MQDVSLEHQQDPYKRYNIPALGFRNYWYPALNSRSIGRKPQRVTMLGENIVLFRDGGQLYALQDRCPHRGTRLSRGTCEFPGSGTISCPYHGWTFDGRTGQCVAALVEGPDAQVAGNRVKAYPVREQAGLVWVFIGDMEAVPLEEDIPEWLTDPGWFAITRAKDYKCNWRALVDNWSQDWHANYVHRYSPEFLLQPAPFARDALVGDLPGNKGVGYQDYGGVLEADFPGVGKWPISSWYRFMKPAGVGTVWAEGTGESGEGDIDGSKFLKQLRLPGYILIGRGHRNYWLCQYATPMGENTTRLFNINIFRRSSLFSELKDRVHYALFRVWAHDIIFSDQDRHILDDWEIGPERLSKTDREVMRWRRFSGEHARRAPNLTVAEPVAKSS